MKEVKVERLLREYGAKAIVIRDDYTVFEVTGQEEEIHNVLQKLTKYGLIEFVKSSRVAINKESHGIHKMIVEMENNNPKGQPITNQYLDQKQQIFQM